MNTDRMALLWSVNPKGNYSDEHHLVGSVLAHMAHIERYGAVYWDLVADANLEQFEDCYPMSGYLYCTDTKAVDYRVRILDISFGPKSEYFPSRKFNDFIKITDEKPVRRQPIGGFTRVRDPLF
ncbi:MAG: hypothetical protein ACW975_02795 [Candidatus Thorarchaeota archaeon]